MKVIHIFKDGTTTNELKDAHVPDEILQSLIRISERKKKGELKNEK